MHVKKCTGMCLHEEADDKGENACQSTGQTWLRTVDVEDDALGAGGQDEEGSLGKGVVLW